MAARTSTTDYRALAELRYRILHFLAEGDATAHELGLEPQQYFLLLAVRGLPAGAQATIRTLAERLALEHNTTVELVDRLERHGYVRRDRSPADHRCVLVRLLPRGERLLEQVARQRITELRGGGAALVNAIDAVLGRRRGAHRRKRVKKENKKAARKKS
ncbi:MAG TPA: MarR family transcriptional regulator [Candidatus Acidoferrales bacterium]|jgi:DNA-binding MarR family transcriptional regulator|nr:MarR family transcriptional regulator [Candidatus Acidoferrales bacterium]